MQPTNVWPWSWLSLHTQPETRDAEPVNLGHGPGYPTIPTVSYTFTHVPKS